MTDKTIKDYYKILGVAPTATQEEIRHAYRRVARASHPDLSTDTNAEERFKELNEAYAVLADPGKRKVYDSLTLDLRESMNVSAPQSSSPTASPSPSPSSVSAPRPGASSNGSTAKRPSSSAPPPSSKPRSRLYPPTWAILLIMLGVCIILGVSVAAFREILPRLTMRPSSGAESVNVSKLATFDSSPTISPDQTVLQEGGTPLLTVLPNQLDLAGQNFSVIPATPEQGRWPVPEKRLDAAVWVYGTVINYVIGLPYTSTTASLLSGLGAGEHITLTLDNGTSLVFGAPQAQRIAANDLSPMSQQQPGLTLVMLGSSQADRLVVRARYLPEEGSTSAGRQRVDGLLVEVLKSGVVQDTGDTRQFLVEYSVNNTTAQPVNPDFFDLVLESGDGQRYALNPEVTTLGEHGALQGAIESGESAIGSAGYLIPRDTRPPLTWIFRADPNSSNSIRHVLAYEAPLPRPAEPVVELSSAFADGARNLIVINGVVRNAGETALTVTLEDIGLTSSAGNSTLQASTPLLPWTIEGAQIQSFEVQFSRPANVNSVLFEILGFSFQIEGLP